jgi:hypothetical protein
VSRDREVAAIAAELENLLDALRVNVTALSAILDPDGMPPQEVAT